MVPCSFCMDMSWPRPSLLAGSSSATHTSVFLSSMLGSRCTRTATTGSPLLGVERQGRKVCIVVRVVVLLLLGVFASFPLTGLGQVAMLWCGGRCWLAV